MRAREQGWRGSIRQLPNQDHSGKCYLVRSVRGLRVAQTPWGRSRGKPPQLRQPRIGGQHGHDDTAYNPHRVLILFGGGWYGRGRWY